MPMSLGIVRARREAIRRRSAAAEGVQLSPIALFEELGFGGVNHT